MGDIIIVILTIFVIRVGFEFADFVVDWLRTKRDDWR